MPIAWSLFRSIIAVTGTHDESILCVRGLEPCLRYLELGQDDSRGGHTYWSLALDTRCPLPWKPNTEPRRCYSSARELRIACQMDSIATFLAECPLLYSPVACVRATHAASLTAIGICTYPEWKC